MLFLPMVQTAIVQMGLFCFSHVLPLPFTSSSPSISVSLTSLALSYNPDGKERPWFLPRALSLLSIALSFCSAAVQISTHLQPDPCRFDELSTRPPFVCSVYTCSSTLREPQAAAPFSSGSGVEAYVSIQLNTTRDSNPAVFGNIYQFLPWCSSDDRAFCTYSLSSIFITILYMPVDNVIANLHSILAGSPLGNCRYPLSPL